MRSLARSTLAAAAVASAIASLPRAGIAEAKGFAGVWRLAGRSPTGAFAGEVKIEPSGDGFKLSFRRVGEKGGEDAFVATGRAGPGGSLVVERQPVETSKGIKGTLGVGAGPTTIQPRATFRPAGLTDRNARELRGAWSPSGVEEALVEVRETPGMLVVGHRGSPRKAPENTLDSYAQAVADGARGIETDLCVTQDGHVAIWHDRDPDSMIALARQAGLEGQPFRSWNPNLFTKLRRPMEKLTLAEWRANYGLQGKRWRNGKVEWGRLDIQLPVIQDALRFLALAPSIERFYLDTKLGAHDAKSARRMAEVVSQTIRGDPFLQAARVGSRLCWLQEDKQLLEEIRRTYGSAPEGSRPHFAQDYDMDSEHDAYDLAQTMRLDSLSIGWAMRSRKTFERLVTNAARKRAESRGRPGVQRIEQVAVWTLNGADEWDCAVKAGADAILTDEPESLRRWLDGAKARGGREPLFAAAPSSRDSARGSTTAGYVGGGSGGVAGAVGGALKTVVRFLKGIFG